MLTSKKPAPAEPSSATFSATKRPEDTFLENTVSSVHPPLPVQDHFCALFDASPLAVNIAHAGIIIYANPAFANLLGIPDPSALLDRSFQDFLAPPQEEILPHPSRERTSTNFYSQPTHCEMVLRRTDGTYVPVRAQTSAFPLLEGEATLSFLIDLSEEHRSHEDMALLLEREQRAGQFARELQSLSQSLSRASFPDDIACAAVESCLAASGAFGGVFVVPRVQETGQSVLYLLHSRGYSAEAIAGWKTMKVDVETPVTRAFLSGLPIWVEDLADPIQLKQFPLLAHANNGPRVGALVALPMSLEDRVLGVLGLSFDTARSFDAEERIFLETLASSCAQALERAQFDIERHGLAQRQRESLALLNTLLDSAPVGFALFDRDHRYVLVNEELSRINSLPVEDHLGLRPTDLLPPLGERIEAALERVWETGLPSGEVFFSQGDFEDADFRYAVMSLYPVRVATLDSQSEIIGVGAILQEQTERVRDEKERERLFVQLEGERARFETILQQMPSAVVIAKAPSGQLILGNDQVSRIWKHPFHNAQNIADYAQHYKGFHLDGSELLPEEWPLSRAIQKGEVVRDQEILIERGDGETGIIRINAAPIRDADKNVTAAIAVFDDVTTRAKANASQLFLAEVGALLVADLSERESVEAVARLCVPLVADCCLFLLNSTRASFGVTALAGHPAPTSDAAQKLRAILEEHQLSSTEIAQSLDTRCGTIYPSLTLQNSSDNVELQNLLTQMNLRQVLVAPLIARGRMSGILLWFNTRKQRTFGPEDVALAEELARRVALFSDNARLLQEAQLARDEAEAANRAKDEFLSVVSHELRTPLTPILGWLELLRSAQLNDELREQSYNVIERNALLQAQLVNDILDVTRITTGKMRLELEDVLLEKIVTHSVDSQRQTIADKQLELCLDIQSSFPIRGDSTRLGQAIGNLLQNAIKFTQQGQISVTLRRSQSPSLGLVARLEVRDEGTGIEPDVQSYIFERFRQGDSSATRTAGGLGLGLSIVKQVVELHGGSIGVVSAGRGQGATFWLEIPLLKAASAESQSASSLSQRSSLQNARILVVDDEPDTREMLARLLEDVAANVRVAPNGRVALEIASQFAPDIIVSDIGMPEMNGLELRRELRARGFQMPAVALTAYASFTDQLAAQDAGFERYLSKPIGTQELIETLVQLLASS